MSIIKKYSSMYLSQWCFKSHTKIVPFSSSVCLHEESTAQWGWTLSRNHITVAVTNYSDCGRPFETMSSKYYVFFLSPLSLVSLVRGWIKTQLKCWVCQTAESVQCPCLFRRDIVTQTWVRFYGIFLYGCDVNWLLIQLHCNRLDD